MRILYGVVGEGMGHATRSRVVMEHLLAAGHQLRVVVSGRAHAFMLEVFRDHPQISIHEIHGLHLDYEGNAIDLLDSVLSNISKAPRGLLRNIASYSKTAEDGFAPELVVSLQASLDGAPVATNTVPGLPAEGPTSALYDATYLDLGVGDYASDAEATGHDNAGNGDVTAVDSFHLLQLAAGPPAEDNELSEDWEHTVYGQILGGTGPDRDIDFLVGGQNAGTAVPGGGAIEATPGGGPVFFEYAVPISCDSLGQDTITVSATIGSEFDSIVLTKDWLDTIAPVAECIPTVNPHGNNDPNAPGNGGQGQNQDGFYELLAEDNLVIGCAPLELFVTDDGSGTVFGPFPVGTKIKYTQDPDEVPAIQPMGGNNGNGNGQGNAVDWHIWGTGDAVLTAVDQSGNISDPVNCLVPPPPQ